MLIACIVLVIGVVGLSVYPSMMADAKMDRAICFM